MSLRIFNSLSRKIEVFKPINPPRVGMYTCGPTVYDHLHIGNLRTAILMDTLKRALKYLGWEVISVMNVTDVDDKIEKKARETGKLVDEITSCYEQIYMNNLKSLNISADLYPHASHYIKEQIEFVKKLSEKGFAYQNKYGVYFDISKDSDYGKLGNTFKSSKERSRIETAEDKRNPEDFALWKFPLEGEQRQKLWNSPWGKGFPGWHIECSVMTKETLGKVIDIHLGGEDLKETHHENELAQSESVSGKTFVRYWVHGGMLNTRRDKMSKSLGNYLTLEEVVKRGFSPLALRYFYFTAHYRSTLNFSWASLDSAQKSLDNIKEQIMELKNLKLTVLSVEKLAKADKYRQEFVEAINNDLNMPQAVAVLWEVLKSNIPGADKLDLVLDFDSVFGLKLGGAEVKETAVPDEVKQLIARRGQLRKEQKWEEADAIRKLIKNKGFVLEDTSEGSVIKKSLFKDSEKPQTSKVVK